MDIIRVQRLIIYEGPRHLVEKQIEKSVHGTREFGNGTKVFAVTLASFPEVIPPPTPVEEPTL